MQDTFHIGCHIIHPCPDSAPDTGVAPHSGDVLRRLTSELSSLAVLAKAVVLPLRYGDLVRQAVREQGIGCI